MWFLNRAQLHRKIGVVVIPAVVVQHLAGETVEHDLERFVVEATDFGVRDTKMADLECRDATPNTELETPPAQVIEHANLFDQPERSVERQNIDQRPEKDAAGALGDCGEEHAG